ncbi:MAG: winged helix-turn-helix transcriptional regulator [Alkalibacterium sp.]|nr:winged helix-turn-helix transcriptional regulator [Alkalibacterium sp.]
MENLMRYINRTSRLSELYRNDKMKEYDLRGMHHTYILNICRNPGVSQEDLAQLIFVNKSNVARQLSVLEKKGYIIRKKCHQDARRLLVYPTDKAKDVYPKVVEILKKWNEIIVEGIPEEEQAVLERQLKCMMEKARAEVQDF